MLTIDYPSRVIFVPRAYMVATQVEPSEVRELNLNSFYLDLRALEYSAEGMVYPECVSYAAENFVSGAALAQVVKIINDYTITFEDGLYSVNLVGANSDVADRVNRNQVSIRSSNSVGLTYSKQIEDQSFLDGRIFVDTVTAKGRAETRYPAGTFDRPVNNLDDARAIISARGLGERLLLLGTIVANAGDNLARYNIKGDFFANSIVELRPGCIADNINLENCTVSGGYHGATSQYSKCLLVNSNNLRGNIQDSKLQGVLRISGDTDMRDCYGTFVVAPVQPGLSINIIRFSGNMTIANVTDGTTVTVGVMSGLITLDSSCTGGTIVVVDHDYINDNSGPGCDVQVINQHQVTQGGLLSLAAVALADEEVSDNRYKKINKDTQQVIIDKDVIKEGGTVRLVER